MVLVSIGLTISKKYSVTPHNIFVWKFDSQERCTKFALQFSSDNNIVESQQWANEIVEDGIHMFPEGYKHPPHIRKKMSDSRKGMNFTETHKENMRKGIIQARQREKEQGIGLFSKDYKPWNVGKKTGPQSVEHRAAIAKGNLGKTFDTTKLKAFWNTPEARKAQSERAKEMWAKRKQN